MLAEDPARHFVVMGDDGRAAAERLDIDVAERLPDLRVQEKVRAPIQIGHLLVLERCTHEAAGEQVRTKPIDLAA